MFTNKGGCVFPGEHRGQLHAYATRKIAEADGTPVNAPELEWLICEGHYPDAEDPAFVLCACRLCVKRRQAAPN